MRKFKLLVLIIFCAFLTVGCTSSNSDDGSISCNDAKEMIEDDGAILIDVRTSEEYEEGHLDDAVNLAYDSIDESISSVVSSLDDVIIVYCQSGTRSSIAYQTLVDLGYTNVYDLGAMSNCD